MTNSEPQPEELRMLMAMDAAYVSEMRKEISDRNKRRAESTGKGK